MLIQTQAFSILALTVGISIARPQVYRLRLNPELAALLGAVLTIGIGLVPLPVAVRLIDFLFLPVLTIVSLMVITLIAEQAGFFRVLAWRIARAARGDGKRLFTYLFFTGTLVGALFTNDAAVLIFTPLVVSLVEKVKDASWKEGNEVPFYFAVLYVANLVAPLVIGNPINIVVSKFFNIGFVEYAGWMGLPALASVLTTYAGLRLFFRRSIPATCRMPEPLQHGIENPRFLVMSALIVALTLAGFFTEQLTGFPTAYVAAAGAAALSIAYRAQAGGRLAPVGRAIGWDVILFVIGIFVVAHGLRNAGLTLMIGDLIQGWTEPGKPASTFLTGFIAAAASAVMNNHPVANTMAIAIRDLPAATELGTHMMVFSALIGGDLGPKMLPIGSLAALLWFRILRDKGIDMPYGQYIRIGVPVTLAAIFLSILTLNLELALFLRLH